MTLDAAYCSDLRRTVDTARLIAPERKIISHLELRECHFGLMEGKTFAQVEQDYPFVSRQWLERSADLAFPCGESLRQLLRRSALFFRRIRYRHPGETVLVVAHDGPLRAGLVTLLRWRAERWWDFRLALASLSIIETRSHWAQLLLFNDTSHLKGLA